jgi:hypothetical protein
LASGRFGRSFCLRTWVASGFEAAFRFVINRGWLALDWIRLMSLASRRCIPTVSTFG